MEKFLGVRVHNGLRYDEVYDEDFKAYYVYVRKGTKVVHVQDFETDDEAWNYIIEETKD